jgi:AhpD family alkylhydroperoxidase
MEALQAVGAIVAEGGLPDTTVHLVLTRASQINGCAVCLDGHTRTARKAGETDERLGTLAAWRETPYFSEAERAALALTEALTRISDRPEPISDAVWTEATRHYDDKGLAALVLCIANINLWNRVNIGTGQVAGSWIP